MTKNLETTLQSYKEGVSNAITINDFHSLCEIHKRCRGTFKGYENATRVYPPRNTKNKLLGNKRTNNLYKRNISRKTKKK